MNAILNAVSEQRAQLKGEPVNKAEVRQTVIIPERSSTDRTAAIGLVEAIRNAGVIVRVSLGEPPDVSGNLHDALTPASQPQPQNQTVKAAG